MDCPSTTRPVRKALKGFSSFTGSVALITDLNATNEKDVFHGFGDLGSVTLDGIGAATKQSDTLYYWGTSDAHTYELEINSNQMVLTKIA